MTTAAFALATFLSAPAFAQAPQQPTPAPMPNPQTTTPEPGTPRTGTPQTGTPQTGTPQTDAQQSRTNQAAMSVEGELVDVDATEKTIKVKSADGKEEKLSYNDETKVTGADRGIAGLANAEGTRVTVRFTGKGDDRVASDITVHAKS